MAYEVKTHFVTFRHYFTMKFVRMTNIKWVETGCFAQRGIWGNQE